MSGKSTTRKILRGRLKYFLEDIPQPVMNVSYVARPQVHRTFFGNNSLQPRLRVWRTIHGEILLFLLIDPIR